MADGAKRFQPGKLYHMSLSDLHPDPLQPRKFFDERALGELHSSIKKHGILDPLLVRRSREGGFTVVSGERRYQAAIKAGLSSVPVILTNGDPVEISIVENLTAIEEAEAIERLRNEHSYTLGDLSDVLGKAQSTLSEILSINKLPETVKNDCRNDPKAARYILTEIAKHGSPGKMTALYEKYKARGLTRGELRMSARAPKAKGSSVDLSFVTTFLKRLNALEPEHLEAPQVKQLAEALEALRVAAQTKLAVLQGTSAGK